MNDTYTKIVMWLYLNHNAYESAESWREAFLEFLKDTLSVNDTSWIYAGDLEAEPAIYGSRKKSEKRSKKK